MDILPAAPPAATPARFAPPPWDRRSPEWLRLDARLPHDHLARRLARLLARLDLSVLLAAYAGKGSLPYRPDLLLLVALYEVSLGHNSPARWHKAAIESEPARWLAMGCQPSRSRWYAFRDRIGPHLPDLVSQLVRLALAEGLTAARRAALDGTSVASLASRHRLVNAATLASRLALLAAAVKADDTPPAAAAAAAAGWMARTPAGRLRQLGRYRKAEAALAERRRLNSLRRKEDRRPDGKVCVSLGDPQAAYGQDKLKTYRPLYNAQLCVDLDTPLVLAYEAYARPTDAGALPAMLGRIRLSLGRAVSRLLADSKYAAGAELAAAEREGVEVFSPWQAKEPGKPRPGKKRPPQLPKELFAWRPDSRTYECPQGRVLRRLAVQRRERDGRAEEYEVYRANAADCAACPRRGECARGKGGRTVRRGAHEEQLERLRERMKTDEARALYRLRAQTVELGFADIREHRGLRRVPGYGLDKARAALGLVALAHNLRVIGSLLAKRAAQARPRTFPLPTVT